MLSSNKNHNTIRRFKDKNAQELVTISYSDLESKFEYRKLPNHITNNLTFIEDRNFNKHYGISLKGIARSFSKNLKYRRIVQGGSTITQQLIRTIIPLKHKFVRKIVEILLAPVITLLLGRKRY